MQANDNNNLRVYRYYGHEDEEVPQDVQKLIVEGTVKELPREFCQHFEYLREVILQEGLKVIGTFAFACCYALQKIAIPSTTEVIGVEAFHYCRNLKEIEFVQLPSLREIGRYSFAQCRLLERITPPSTLACMGHCAFSECTYLIEVNLFHTQMTEIPDDAFQFCVSLQSVCLPNSLEHIMEMAFYMCRNLVTVEMSLSANNALDIQAKAFGCCESLCNIQITPRSVVDTTAFEGCTLLHKIFGQESSDIVQGLKHRFDGYPVHNLCFHSAVTTPDKLGQCIDDQGQGQALIDQFDESPFHVLFASVEPRHDLLETLLHSYPGHVLSVVDASGKRAMDYLETNWTEGTKAMLQMALQHWVFNRLDQWGISSWREAMVLRVNSLLHEEDANERCTLWQRLSDAMGDYENLEAISLLEIALWKKKLQSQRSTHGSAKRMAMDRGHVRLLCGSDVVIPNVLGFLKEIQTDSSDGAPSSDED